LNKKSAMNTNRSLTLSVWPALLLALAFVTTASWVMVAFAQQPAPPVAAGSTPEEPIEVPDDSGSAGGMSSSGQNDWKYQYIHNNTGRPADGDDPGDPGKSADWITLACKEPPQHPDEGKLAGRRKRWEHRIVIDEVKKKVNGAWVDVKKNTEPQDGEGSKVKIELDQPLAYCETLRIRMRVERREVEHVAGDKWAPGDWNANTVGNIVNYNVVELLDGFQNKIVQGGSGNDPVGSGWVSVGTVFAGLNPAANFTATDTGANATAVVAAPDLVYSESVGGWSMPTGTLRFSATGGATFASSSSLQLLARNEDGDDAVGEEDISFGIPSIVNGVIEVPILSRNTAGPRVAVMVRGAEVDVPALAAGTLIGYAVGGVPAGTISVRVAPLVRVQSDPTGTVLHSSADVKIEYEDPENAENVGYLVTPVGGLIHMARPDEEGVHQGYIDAIVLGESESGVFRAGSFEITPVDGRVFVASGNTKLFVIKADDHSDASEAFEGGTIEVTQSGALRVTLQSRVMLDTVLKLVILNPKINMGTGPFVAGQNARFAVGGDALRGGIPRTLLLVEGHYGTETDNEYLPNEPLVALDLTAVATVQE
jgi:hypothetical protein